MLPTFADVKAFQEYKRITITDFWQLSLELIMFSRSRFFKYFALLLFC
jgi:hypothetical protein